MLRAYRVFVEGYQWVSVNFDDQKTVNQLALRVLDEVDCYEPLGDDVVTLFEAQSPKDNNGWFLTDSGQKCCDAISNPEYLCLAYHMPGIFYYAEGGWGHHMKHLGNHPVLENPVSFKLVMEDFRNTVVVAGNYLLGDMVSFLQFKEYIPSQTRWVIVDFVGTLNDRLSIPLHDERMRRSIHDVMRDICSYMPEGAYDPVISFR